jgi:hypothetical protein
MNERAHTSLGGFEQRLLHELRAVVAERAAAAPVPIEAAAARRTLRPRWPLGAAAAVVLAAAILFVASPFSGDENGRAWAVVRNGDGSVTVEIDALSDAGGLERKLNEAGVPAVVQYIPPGKTCAGEAPPAHAVTDSTGDRSGQAGLNSSGGHDSGRRVLHSAGAAPASRAHRVGEPSTLQIKAKPTGGIEFTIDAGAHPGETLLIRSQGFAAGQPPAPHPSARGEGSAISVTHVSGRVRPCKLVDSPGRGPRAS